MKKIFALLCLILVAVPIFAFAATTPCTIPMLNGKITPVAAAELPRCVNQIYTWSLGIASLLALLMMVIGGYYYMTASGNAERSSKGVEIIWSSLIGVALLFGAYVLLNTINPDFVNFSYVTQDFSCFNNSGASGCPNAQTTTPNQSPTAPRN